MNAEGGKRHWASGLPAAMAGLAISLVLNYLAGSRADRAGMEANTAPDVLFSVVPVVDMRLIYVWGFGAFVALLVLSTLLWERRRAAAITWSYALLIAVRSFFIVLTPMRTPPEALHITQDWLFEHVGRYLTFRHDLFFSSHTALPYLGFLLFKGRPVRWAFLVLSGLLAASVLLIRLHYSIDVAAAYFITYALYRASWPRLRRL